MVSAGKQSKSAVFTKVRKVNERPSGRDGGEMGARKWTEIVCLEHCSPSSNSISTVNLDMACR